jgi:hypothetical protein
MSSSSSDNSDTDCKLSKKIKCENCGKSFSYHQGLYTHKKSKSCKQLVANMVNSKKYINTLEINMNELILCDDINKVFKYLFKHNQYDRLPFIIYDKKRKLVRFLTDDNQYIIDKDYVIIENFLNKIRYMIIKQINKDKLADGDENTSSNELKFLSVMLSDFNIKNIMTLILQGIEGHKIKTKIESTPLYDEDYDCENDENN